MSNAPAVKDFIPGPWPLLSSIFPKKVPFTRLAVIIEKVTVKGFVCAVPEFKAM
jgi:hypothetical protein